jgi:hypothetical protein
MLLILSVFLFSLSGWSLPIDWTGNLSYDTTLINNFRRTKDDITKTAGSRNGTQGIASGDDSAHFQTYLFKLNPNMIVNDSVTIRGELSTGHIRGGVMGDNTTQNQDGTSGSNAYFHTSPAQRSSLNVNQLYAEIFADTALIKIGRMSKGFGMGALLNNGDKPNDRFFTLYDGIQGEMKIGNFSLTPHWARLSTYNDTANRSEPSGRYDVRELGVAATYDNKAKNLILAFMYAKRFSEARNSLYNSNQDAGDFDRGNTHVTLIDAYLEKRFEKFKFAVEVPLLSGDYGHVYDATTDSQISSSSILAQTLWNASNKWDVGFDFGQVGGDKGSSNRFEGMALHPNFHIAELMFRYNYTAFNEGGKSIFDANITNTRYFKLHTVYKSDKWNWKTAFITAKAQQTGASGKQSYHHEEGYRYLASKNQNDDFGMEFDFGFDYAWNPNVTLSGFFAYWFVGDYYAFDNTATDIDLQNVMGAGLRLNIAF